MSYDDDYEDYESDEADEYDVDDADDDVTVPCPYCGQEVYDDAEQCPNCGEYLSLEDSPRAAKPWWVVLGVTLCLVAMLWWIVVGF